MFETSILDSLDWKILLTYDRKPFQSYNAISKIVGVHHSTVSDRIDHMKSKRVLRQDRVDNDPRLNRETSQLHYVKRQKSEVIGTYSPSKMGLVRINLILRKFKTVKDLNLMIKFVDDHNYTHYYAPLYGQGANLFVQMDIPPSTLKLHLSVFRILQEELIDFEEIDVYQDVFEANSVGDLESQVKKNQESRETGSNYINDLWIDFLENRIESTVLTQPTQSISFDNLDAELIREIGINAKVNISNLTDYYQRDKSTLSRRMKKIRQNFVMRATLLYDIQADRLHGFQNSHIIVGKFSGGEELNRDNFMKFINNKDVLPFHTFTVVNNERFMLYIRSTVGVSGNLMQFLLNNTDPLELNQYQYYLPESRTYPFWYGNYDESDGYNTSHSYIKDDPLGDIKNYQI